MSLKVSSLVWQQMLKGQTKLVLLALADYADDHGCCYASIKRIAYKCGLGRSTTARHLHWLCQQGFLQVTHQHRQNGTRACNAYLIQFPELQNQSPELANQSLRSGIDKVPNRDGNYINGYYNSHKNVLCPKTGLSKSNTQSTKSALRGAL